MSAGRTLLVTGAEGRLAATVVPAFRGRGWEVLPFGRRLLDITDRGAVSDCTRAVAPDVVLNLAAWTDVVACEREPERAVRINARAVGHLREAAESVGAHLVHISSDYVFDGASDRPYVEGDPARPVNAYGVSKLLSEAEAGEGATVLRTSWISGRAGRCLVRSAIEAAATPDGHGGFVTDEFGSPTVADDLVRTLEQVATQRLAGIYHVAGDGMTSPWGLARHVFEELGLDPDRVVATTTADRRTALAVERPRCSSLDSGALRQLGIDVPGGWRASVSRLVAEIEAHAST